MKDEENRERLSAYLDGELPEVERKAVEDSLARSEDLRRELSALRAVSSTVKGLPKAGLPPGFIARLAARSELGAAPERNWVFLPPGYRPLALALSTAVVALVVWDKTQSPSESIAPRVGWQGDKVALKTAAEAPDSQMDLSGRLAAMSAIESAISAASVQRGAQSGLGRRGLGRRAKAAGKPVEVAEARGAQSGFDARNEEERSAINERLYKGFEQEKKRMGIAKILDKESGGNNDELTDAAPLTQEMTSLDVKPEALLARVIILKNAETLQTAWAAAGLAGNPPIVDFPKQMALFLACPPGCGIVSVRTEKKFLTVLYGDSGFKNASARVRAVPASLKPAVLMRAP